MDVRLITARSPREAFRNARLQLGIGLDEIDHFFGAEVLDAEKTCWRLKITQAAAERLKKDDRPEVLGFRMAQDHQSVYKRLKGPGF